MLVQHTSHVAAAQFTSAPPVISDTRGSSAAAMASAMATRAMKPTSSQRAQAGQRAHTPRRLASGSLAAASGSGSGSVFGASDSGTGGCKHPMAQLCGAHARPRSRHGSGGGAGPSSTACAARCKSVAPHKATSWGAMPRKPCGRPPAPSCCGPDGASAARQEVADVVLQSCAGAMWRLRPVTAQHQWIAGANPWGLAVV